MKKIQVYGVTERDNANQPLLVLRDISTQGGIAATVRTLVNERGTAREAQVVLRQGDDLFAKTGREEYRDSYRVTEIHTGLHTIEFENGVTLTGADTVGANKVEVFRQQIEATIEQHMRLQERLLVRGIKVLTLFFIDAVASYVDEGGIIRTLFDAAFDKGKNRYPSFQHLQPAQVRSAYFAKRKLPSGEEQAIDIAPDSAKDRDAAREAFQLIMRDKERLLSFDVPVSFIFAHSALKEGWDNPNVFQICTLNDAVSAMRKRQEIGRGLRLCVDQEGERVTDDEVNILTVVANESYGEYADALQKEYFEDGEMAPPRPSNAHNQEAKRNDRIFLHDQEFRLFWARLTRKMSYRIHVDTEELVERCVERLNAQQFPKPMLVVEKGEFTSIRYTMKLVSVHHGKATLALTREARGKAPEELIKIVERGTRLARAFGDDRLRRFVVLDVIEEGEQSRLLFDEDDVELDRHTPYMYESMMGQIPREQVAIEPDSTFPVFNLLDRSARETGLIRRRSV